MASKKDPTSTKWSGLPMWCGCCACDYQVLIDERSLGVLSEVEAEFMGELLPVRYPFGGDTSPMGNYVFCGECATMARWFGVRRRKLNLAVLKRALSVHQTEALAPHELPALFADYDSEERRHRGCYALHSPEAQRVLGYDLFGGEVVVVEPRAVVAVDERTSGVIRAYDQLLLRYGRSVEERDGIFAQ